MTTTTKNTHDDEAYEEQYGQEADEHWEDDTTYEEDSEATRWPIQ